jgi:glutamine amidotransferase
MWMHNGGIGGWKHLKRKLAASVGEKWFMGVQGSTDTEWAFAVFLDSLEQEGVDPSADPGEKGVGHVVLRRALLRTIERINEFTEEVKKSLPEEQAKEVVSLLNFAVTDGHDVVCSRYVSSKHDEAASLFFSSGTSWRAPGEGEEKGNYRMERRDKGADIVLVASEPLTFERGMLFHHLCEGVY